MSEGECVGIWYKVVLDTCFKLENISIMQRAGINHLAKDVEIYFDDYSKQKVKIAFNFSIPLSMGASALISRHDSITILDLRAF